MITRAICVLSALASLNLATLALGGDLNPPAAPASTMVTLEEVNTAVEAAQDSRTPISSLPVTITESGSYVVVANLTQPIEGEAGITIEADNVTLDLNGHTLNGPNSGPPSHGITGSSANTAIFNGTVRDFQGSGIYLPGQNLRINQVNAYSNGGDGISIGTNGVIYDCCSRLNGADGILTGNGTVVRGNSCRENTGDGIQSGGGSAVTGNACYGNGSNGIRANESLVSNNACHSNSGTNISNTGLSVDNYAP